MNAWEIHPYLVHFPIALLLSAVVMEFVNVYKKRETINRAAAGLLVGGVITGWIAAIFGFVALFTVPAHTTEAREWIFWHLGLNALAMVIFTFVAVIRWRQRPALVVGKLRAAQVVAALLMISAGYLGGQMVLQGGVGVSPEILSTDVVHQHSPTRAEPEFVEGTMQDLPNGEEAEPSE